jgi:hypothetical protein
MDIDALMVVFEDGNKFRDEFYLYNVLVEGEGF